MRNFCILITLLIVGNLFAQEEKYNFTLQEAIAFALENNYSAINAERDILDAQKQKWETIADGLPQLNGSVNYQNQLKQPVSLIPAEFAGGEPGTYIPVVFGQPQSLNATATLTQQIFNGSYIVGVQATKTFMDYSRNNKEKTEQEVRKSVVEAYGNVLLADEALEILEKNKATLEKNLYETTKLYENGLADEESKDQLQITLTSIQNELNNAIRLKLITIQMLNLNLGLPLDTPTSTTDNLDVLTEQQIDLELLEADLKLENNVDYKIALNLNEQRQLELKLAKSYALPSLNAFLNYGTSGFSDSFTFFNSSQNWFNSSVLGLDLKIPIFSSLKRSAGTQRAKIALEQAKTQLTEAEQQIKLQLANAKSNYILAIRQYENSKDNLELAERIEGKNEIKYFEGISSSFDLRQAQNQLYGAQREYLESMVEVINTKVALENILNKKS